jgi:hypothetical protein
MKESNTTYKMFETMKQHKAMVTYHGEFTFESINNILLYARRDIQMRNVQKRTSRKVYAILVEALENILRHGVEKEYNTRTTDGVFILYKTDQGFTIKTGNLIKNEDIGKLKDEIKLVSEKNITQLKEAYREQLRNGAISNKGGAGIGLIDMAIKANKDLTFNLFETDPDTSFFELTINIHQEEDTIAA